jgi:hypothetical protein
MPAAVPGARFGFIVCCLASVPGEGLLGADMCSSSAALVGLLTPRPMLAVSPTSALPSLTSAPVSSDMVMPASSRILSSLNLSRRLPWLDRLVDVMSPSSSILPSVCSGLLPRVLIEAPVFLRSDTGGGETSAFLLELLRDSHANGLVSFRATGGAGMGFSCAGGGGGGGNLTGGIAPEKPCSEVVESRESRGGSLGAGAVGFATSVYCQPSWTYMTSKRWLVAKCALCRLRLVIALCPFTLRIHVMEWTHRRRVTHRPCLKSPRFCAL